MVHQKRTLLGHLQCTSRARALLLLMMMTPVTTLANSPMLAAVTTGTTATLKLLEPLQHSIRLLMFTHAMTSAATVLPRTNGCFVTVLMLMLLLLVLLQQGVLTQRSSALQDCVYYSNYSCFATALLLATATTVYCAAAA
jgi:hypothetical protein